MANTGPPTPVGQHLQHHILLGQMAAAMLTGGQAFADFIAHLTPDEIEILVGYVNDMAAALNRRSSAASGAT